MSLSISLVKNIKLFLWCSHSCIAIHVYHGGDQQFKITRHLEDTEIEYNSHKLIQFIKNISCTIFHLFRCSYAFHQKLSMKNVNRTYENKFDFTCLQFLMCTGILILILLSRCFAECLFHNSVLSHMYCNFAICRCLNYFY